MRIPLKPRHNLQDHMNRIHYLFPKFQFANPSDGYRQLRRLSFAGMIVATGLTEHEMEGYINPASVDLTEQEAENIMHWKHDAHRFHISVRKVLGFGCIPGCDVCHGDGYIGTIVECHGCERQGTCDTNAGTDNSACEVAIPCPECHGIQLTLCVRRGLLIQSDTMKKYSIPLITTTDGHGLLYPSFSNHELMTTPHIN